MTYDKLIKLIKKEKTGIAKGYSMSFLQDTFVYLRSEDDLQNLFNKDLSLFKEIEISLLKSRKPNEGDFVEYEEGKFARISHIHAHEDNSIQLSNKIGVYVSRSGSSQASGCTWDPEVKHGNINISDLIATTKTKKGSCWIFSQSLSGAGRGVNFEMEFRVWKLK